MTERSAPQALTVVADARYRRRLTEDHFHVVLAEIRDLIDGGRLPTGARVPGLADAGGMLLHRARHDTRDGYPTSSRGGSGRSVGSHSDPVGDLVAAGEMADPTRVMAVDMCEALLVARDVLRRAHGAWQRSVPPKETEPEKGAAGCVVHARYGLYVAARARGRCRWCADWSIAWARDHDQELKDPPEDAIRALEERRVEREVRGVA